MSPDAEYYRAYRAQHRERINAQVRARRSRGRIRKDRTQEYMRRKSRAVSALTPLFPDIIRGSELSFWEDELKMDLRQVAALAKLEGQSVTAVCRRYARAERSWRNITTHLFEATTSDG